MPERDHAWFEALFREHVGAVGRYAVRRAPGEADDLTAETFATAWRRRDDLPEGAELPWLYRTCGYLIANLRRRTTPVLVDEFPELPDDVDPETVIIRDEQVRLALAALSPRDRQILLVHAWDGLAGDELAAFLGVSRGGADAALSRARSRLRSAWDQVQDPQHA